MWLEWAYEENKVQVLLHQNETNFISSGQMHIGYIFQNINVNVFSN